MEPTCLFDEHFWGEKHSGFDVLIQNLKISYRSTNEFIEFLRESHSIEDTYVKSLFKLGKLAGSFSSDSSFKPCWSHVRSFLDQMGRMHLDLVQKRQEFIKDVQKYMDEQAKRHKAIKDSESSTQEVVHAFQVTAIQLHKAKETYHTRYGEYQRVMRNESASPKDQEKVATKLKKAQNEYQYSVEKYNNLRDQFVTKMHSSCAHFQELEEAHLEQMHKFLARYLAVWSSTQANMLPILDKFHNSFEEITTDRLLAAFVSSHGTGLTEPQCVQFEEVESISPSVANGDAIPAPASTKITNKLDIIIGREARASPAKERPANKRFSLLDITLDGSGLIANKDATQPITIPTTGSAAPAKRCEGIFRRYRTSLYTDSTTLPSQSASTLSISGSTESTQQKGNIQSSASLSAFNIVTKRSLGFLNGKENKTNRNSTAPKPEWSTVFQTHGPVDEEGYSVRPEDPWSEDPTLSYGGSSDSDSMTDQIDVLDRTFRGIKVTIRPVGELAPSISTLPSHAKDEDSTQSSTSVTGLPERHPQVIDRRGSGKSEQKLNDSDQFVDASSLVTRLPTAPALPPPPPSSSNLLGPNSNTRCDSDTKLVTKRQRFTHVMCTNMDSVYPTANSQLFSPTQLDSHSSGNRIPQGTSVTNQATWDAFGEDEEQTTTTSDLVWPSNSTRFPRKNDETSSCKRVPSSPPVPPTRVRNVKPLHADENLSQCENLTYSPTPSSFSLSPSSSSSDPIAIAAAFTENWQAVFHNGGGSSFSTAAQLNPPPNHSISGELSLAFSRAISDQLTLLSERPLILRLTNASRLQNIRLLIEGSTIQSASNSFLSSPSAANPSDLPPNEEGYFVRIPGSVLAHNLKSLLSGPITSMDNTVSKPTPYIRLNLLTYSVNLAPVGSDAITLTPPINLCSYWSCKPDMTDFRLDYATNWPSSGVPPLKPLPRCELRINLRMNGSVERMQSFPRGAWTPDTHCASWKIPLTPTESESVGCTNNFNSSGTVSAKFFINNGPSKPQPVSLQFLREDSLSSGIQVSVHTQDYRLTLCKRRMIGDRYICYPPNYSIPLPNRSLFGPSPENNLDVNENQTVPSHSSAFQPVISHSYNPPMH